MQSHHQNLTLEYKPWIAFICDAMICGRVQPACRNTSIFVKVGNFLVAPITPALFHVNAFLLKNVTRISGTAQMLILLYSGTNFEMIMNRFHKSYFIHVWIIELHQIKWQTSSIMYFLAHSRRRSAGTRPLPDLICEQQDSTHVHSSG